MKKLLTVVLFAASTLAVANQSDHAEKSSHSGHAEKTEKVMLSKELRQVLNLEMQKIKGGMESLVLANASGNWQQIYQVGHNIKHSYIMAQKLTEQQRHELHQGLPKGFVELDKKFHHYAGMMAHVAKEHDAELVNFFIYKMNETCTACHRQYAPEKFPGFAEKNKHESEHH